VDLRDHELGLFEKSALFNTRGARVTAVTLAPLAETETNGK
jgi:hypothetical protein